MNPISLRWLTPLGALSYALASPVVADEFSPPQLKHSYTDFGGVGLIQMPTARMMQEGEFSASATNNNEYLHYTATLQLFPWLEATIRYTQVHDMLYSSDPGFSGDTKYTDKSMDAKVRLIEESYWLPELSVGVRDFGGTGLFDGEFVAASKQVGPLDFTLGVGWGYLGNRANLSGDKSISVDCGRDTTFKGNGGSVDVNRMFSGCSSLFGGVEYQTPHEPLRLKVEYDGNDYSSDFPVTNGSSDMNVSTPWNFGIVYGLADWADLRLSYERGNTFTAGITMATNLSSLKPNWVDEPRPSYSQAEQRNELSDQEWNELTEEVAQVAGYSELNIYQDEDVIIIEGEPTKYRDASEAHHRAALSVANSGIDATSYHIIDTNHHQPMQETVVNANAFKRVADNDYPDASFDDASYTKSSTKQGRNAKASIENPFYYGFSPVLQQSIGGSENFYLYAIGISADASYELGTNWRASGSVYANLIDNYDKFNYTVPPDGTDLKRVRTLSRQYYDEFLRVDNLQLTHFDRYQESFYTQAYGGYLEAMFAGVGTEIMYRPFGKNWAIGADVNYVVQRDPDSTFGLFTEERHFDEQTSRYYNVQTGTLTGHATLYWQPKFWSLIDDTQMKLSAGRYLSDDVGFTLDYSKQFDSGVTAGAFITKTNLSAEEYGEGSYTKGFYVSIPLDLMTVKPSRERVAISWLPLQRDGGQMLNRKYHLYDTTDIRSPWNTRPAK
ncbi:YjbH domain-containing protein [Vibrio lamellibrachiae]|uniref:YjbH domain-containing protein n=1 Tax=Vibrio lamellibrachiae TaxID=2910253 RepID=UPI003D1030C4